MTKEFITTKVKLKIVEKADAEKIHLLRTDPNVATFIERDLNVSVKDVERFIEERLQDFDNILFYKIEAVPSDELVGTIVLKNLNRKNKYAEIGYELFPKFQGQGLMTLAIKIIIDLAFEELGLRQLEAFTNKKNIKSRNLLERFEFKETQKMDPKYPDNVIYRLSYQPATTDLS
jgi:ribosomal-protein-alanine N-acetyltransferase